MEGGTSYRPGRQEMEEEQTTLRPAVPSIVCPLVISSVHVHAMSSIPPLLGYPPAPKEIVHDIHPTSTYIFCMYVCMRYV